MPKRTDLHKVLVIGSGPIVIGQAAEFDYAGTQACLALREEGYEVVLVKSNPATIMTDTTIADKVYMEPLTLEYVARICRFERPDAIIPGIGGQTGLNLAMQLAKKGVLEECGIRQAGLLAAVTDHDATNLLVAELASEIYNVERVIPRIEDESLLKILEDMNVSPICPHLVCMEQLAGTIGLRQGKGALR